MPLPASFAAGLLRVVWAVTLSAMLGALTWAIVRLRRNRTPWLPAEPPRRVPWGLFTVAAVLVAYRVVGAVVGTVVLSWAAPGPAGPPPAMPAAPSFAAAILVVTLLNAAVVVMVPSLVGFLSHARPADLGLDLSRFRTDARAGAVAFLLVTPWVYASFGLAQLVHRGDKHPLEKMLLTGLNPGLVLLAVASAVVFAPLAEELMFRGVLQGCLQELFRRGREGDGPSPHETWTDSPSAPAEGSEAPPRRTDWLPVVVTSLLFAGMHYQEWPAPVALFPLSLVLGYLYQRTGRLVAPVVLHALFNAFSTLQLLTVLTSVGPGKTP